MKKALVIPIIFASVIATVFSCKKEMFTEVVTDPQGNANKAPVVSAGADQVIAYPADSVLLSGTASTQPGTPVRFLWMKVSGPDSFLIVNDTSAKTIVRKLVVGIYQFELKVTDAAGRVGRDFVQVTVTRDYSLSILWQKMIGGSRIDVAQAIQPTTDGGYVMVGNTNSEDGDIAGYHSAAYDCYLPCIGPSICGLLPDGLVVKLSSTGDVQWQKSFGGSAAENLLSIQQTPDGGYIASGLTYSNDGDVHGYHGGDEADAWVLKLSSSGGIEWQKVLGGGTGCDFANYILPAPDGGYVFVGHTDSHDGDVSSNAGERDVWLVKLTGTGAIEWQKTIGGSKNDYAYSFQFTPDGGSIIAGYTYSNNGDVSGNHGDADAWVVKVTHTGAIEWQKALGGDKEDIARSVQPTRDGGYIVVGSTRSNNGNVLGNHGAADAWIIKLGSNGVVQWQRAFGGSSEDIARSVQVTAEGGYIVAGSTSSYNGDVNMNYGGTDAWIVRLSNFGFVLWEKSYGGTSDELVNSIQRTTDGEYIVAGQSGSGNGAGSGNHGLADAWVLKLKN